MQVEPGSVIAGRYEVVKRIGAGGMGMVFQAIDHELNDAVVALKLLLPHLASDEQIFKRFLNEVLVARSLSHPNIVRLHDIGKVEGSYYYISMELVDGYSLKERITVEDEVANTASTQFSFKPLTFDEALQILFDISSGVSYAHTKGVLHRDLKPGNVLISKKGEVKLADFGTARIMGMDTSLTQTGQVIGTPDYMSPEQIRGEALDSACDIYSLGLIGYELVTGCRPYVADSAVAIAFKHLSEPLPPFGEKLKHIPGWYRALIEKATAKDRKQRFQNGKEFLADLQKNLTRGNESFSGGGFSGILETGKFELGDSVLSSASPNDWKFGESSSTGVTNTVAPKKKKGGGGNLFIGLLFLVTLGLGYGFFKFRDKLIPVDNLPSARLPELGTDEIVKQIENLSGSAKEIKISKPVASEISIASSEAALETNILKTSEESPLIALTTPTPEPTVKPTPELIVREPSVNPTQTATPSPKPTEVNKEVSASLQLKLSGKAAEEFPADSLSKASWEVSLEGLSMSESEELLINLVNATHGTLITKMKPTNISTRGDRLTLIGRFEGIARTLQQDKYRLDILRSGELLATTRFSVLPKSAPLTVDEPSVPLERTPAPVATLVTPELEPTETAVGQAVTRSYGGSIELAAEDGASVRALNLSLIFQGLEISGTGRIEGFGEVVVSGKELVRGYEITLRGNDIQLRLTSGKGTTMLKGSYLVAGKPIRGAWQVKLQN